MKWVSIVCLSVALIAGCQNPSTRLNAPPQGHSTNPDPMQQPFKTMVNNAALADMSVADIHFAGTSAELNGTGQAQMQRLTRILKTYGGDLRYTTDLPDQKLVQARINRLEDYLASAGVDMTKVTVHQGMPASVGMSAAEAIKAQQAPTAKCGQASSSDASGASGLMPGAGGAK